MSSRLAEHQDVTGLGRAGLVGIHGKRRGEEVLFKVATGVAGVGKRNVDTDPKAFFVNRADQLNAVDTNPHSSGLVVVGGVDPGKSRGTDSRTGYHPRTITRTTTPTMPNATNTIAMMNPT